MAFGRAEAQRVPRDALTADDDERQRTLDIIHRLETGAGVVDVDDKSPAELLAMLTPEERERFEAGLAREPWFAGDAWPDVAPFLHAVHAAFPAPRQSADLRFNVLALLCIYAYVVRELGVWSLAGEGAEEGVGEGAGEEDEPPALEEDVGPVVSYAGGGASSPSTRTPHALEEGAGPAESHAAGGTSATPSPTPADVLLALAPFLGRSRLVLADAADAILYTLQMLARYAGPQPTHVVAALLRDVQAMLRRRIVGAGAPRGAEDAVLHALGDMHAVVPGAAAARKLLFYAQACMYDGAGVRAAAADAAAQLEREEAAAAHVERVVSANRTLSQMEGLPRKRA